MPENTPTDPAPPADPAPFDTRWTRAWQSLREQWLFWSLLVLIVPLGGYGLTAYEFSLWPFGHHHAASAQPEVPGEFFSENTKAVLRVVLLALALFFIGLYFLQLAERWSAQANALTDPRHQERRTQDLLWSHVTRDVAIAFIVGAVTVVSFEASLRFFEHVEQEAQRSLMAKDVFRYTYGYSVEKGLMEEVQADVILPKLVRDDWLVEYQFHEADEKRGLLKLLTTVTYHLRNRSGDEVPYPLSHYFHSICPIPESRDEFLSLEIESPDPAAKMPCADQEMLSACTAYCVDREEKERAQALGRRQTYGPRETVNVVDAARNQTGIRLVRYKDGSQCGIQTIDPIIIPPRSTIKVRYSYEQTRRFTDMTTMVTVHPAMKLEVCVHIADPKLAKLRLEADSAHRLDPEKVPVLNTKDRCTRWEIKSALLPGQGVELYWYPEEVLARRADKAAPKEAPPPAPEK
jgi:hypothetical protein